LSPVVIDASVGVKWYFTEPDGEPLATEADLLLQSYLENHIRILVPDLFYAEFANVFWKAERQGRMTTRRVEAALESVLKLPLEVTPTVDVVREASVIARKYDRTVYDSIYLALAVRTGYHLITADNRLVSAVGNSLPVFWLGSV
jgi:predicted nucleic acid-binding protein